MNRRKLLWPSVCIGILFYIFFAALIVSSVMQSATHTQFNQRATSLTEVTAVENGKEKVVTLPHSFTDLPPRTPVTITSAITVMPEDCLYIKSVYATLKGVCR